MQTISEDTFMPGAPMDNDSDDGVAMVSPTRKVLKEKKQQEFGGPPVKAKPNNRRDTGAPHQLSLTKNVPAVPETIDDEPSKPKKKVRRGTAFPGSLPGGGLVTATDEDEGEGAEAIGGYEAWRSNVEERLDALEKQQAVLMQSKGCSCVIM